MQRSFFDADESEVRRLQGMTQAAANHGTWLEATRAVAVQLCRERGTISADDLRAAGVETPPGASYNVWGSVFNDPRFTLAGFTKSARPIAHRNLLRLWRLTRER